MFHARRVDLRVNSDSSVDESKLRRPRYGLSRVLVIGSALAVSLLVAAGLYLWRLQKLPLAARVELSTATTCCASVRPWVCVDGTETTVGFSLRSSQPLRIGFITYSTGPYNAFVEDLWRSINQHAFRDHEVHLFLFTDRAADSSFLPGGKVHKRQQERVGWPFDSMGRHFLFRDAKDWYNEMDYMISVDSDSILSGPLDSSMLGERIGAIQAWFYGHEKSYWTNDRRLTPVGTPYTHGYISDEAACCYFTGNLFGGSRTGFIEILEECTSLALLDLGSVPPRVALWHDETYLNRVFVDHPPTIVLKPNFMYPEPPADEWLYTQDDKVASRLWHSDDLASRRYPLSQLKFLNLGVRKHANKELRTYQPLSGVIPAFMSPTGKVAKLPVIVDKPDLLYHDITAVILSASPAQSIHALIGKFLSTALGMNVADVLWVDQTTPVVLLGIQTKYALVLKTDAVSSIVQLSWTADTMAIWGWGIANSLLALEIDYEIVVLCTDVKLTSALSGFPLCSFVPQTTAPLMTETVRCWLATEVGIIENASFVLINVAARRNYVVRDVWSSTTEKALAALCVIGRS